MKVQGGGASGTGMQFMWLGVVFEDDHLPSLKQHKCSINQIVFLKSFKQLLLGRRGGRGLVRMPVNTWPPVSILLGSYFEGCTPATLQPPEHNL